MTLDWLVIGGGPHGVHTALRLVSEAGVPHESVRILDDESRLLARWRRSTRNTGMQYLRSPSVHHIDLSSGGLQRFARRGGRSVDRPFARPYARPALDLFDRHCDDVIERYGLQALHVQGRAIRLNLENKAARIGFGGAHSGDIEARQVVLAIGAPREPEWPGWARRARAAVKGTMGSASPTRIQHIFEPGFELTDAEGDTEIAVIGAGISGAQVALRLARQGRRVILISRHLLRVRQFDSDPGWQGPKYMGGFARLSDPNDRRGRIRAARHRGSMPPDVYRALRSASTEGTIELLESWSVESAHISGREVLLEVAGRTIRVSRVLLATGFPARRPGGAWLDRAVEAFELPCAACGYPIVDRGLRWHPRLFVTGALGELELGPVARNLSGARRAGDRIVAVARDIGLPKASVAPSANAG